MVLIWHLLEVCEQGVIRLTLCLTQILCMCVIYVQIFSFLLSGWGSCGSEVNTTALNSNRVGCFLARGDGWTQPGALLGSGGGAGELYLVSEKFP